jgi:hypothetical protein
MTTVYHAAIYCKYEGATQAQGIFATEEEARKAAPWFTENAEYFNKKDGLVFHVSQFEFNNNATFDPELNSLVERLQYKIDDPDNMYKGTTFEPNSEDIEMLEKLKGYQNATL